MVNPKCNCHYQSRTEINTPLKLTKNQSPVFQVKVPANENKSPVTAILYDTPKFYPDKITVEDFSSALAAQFTSPNRSKKVFCLYFTLCIVLYL